MSKGLKDVLGDETSEAIMDFLGNAASKIQGLGLPPMKAWGEFFKQFKSPKKWDRENLEKRVTTNFYEYTSNYIAVSAGVFLVFLFSSPLLLFILLLCVCLWLYVMVVRKGPLELAGTELDESKKAVACGALTLLVLVLSGQFIKLLGTLFLAVLLVALHLVFRPRAAKNKFNRLAEEVAGGKQQSSPQAGGFLSGLFGGDAGGMGAGGGKRSKGKDKDVDMEGGLNDCEGEEETDENSATGVSSSVNMGGTSGNELSSRHNRQLSAHS